MTDSLTLDPAMGQIGQLRLHAPATSCPFRESAASSFPNFERFNVAFQLATGWSLGWYETADSRQSRKKRGRPDYPATGQLAIDDLSVLLPPGIPAASRIYCEKLVVELNETVAEFQQAQVDLWRRRQADPGEFGTRGTTRLDRSHDSRSVHRPVFLPVNAPLRDHNLAIRPLFCDTERAVLDWFADSAGSIRLLMAVSREADAASQAALLTARTTFLAECRHQSPELDTEVAIRETLERLYPEVQIDLATGTLNPLSGQISVTGDHRFRIDGSATDLRIQKISGGTQLTHLSRDEHLFISHWPTAGVHGGYQDEVDEWWWTTIREIRRSDSDSLLPIFENRLEHSIPSLLLPPHLALGLSR